MSDTEFNQWFTGFTDGEGNFYVGIKNNVRFTFSIKLHIADLKALETIKSRLNCGQIYLSENAANYYITSAKDISNILIPLFEKFPLNGAKYLDYLAFKQAINIHLDSSLSKENKTELISQLCSSMNTKRNDFNMPSNHTIRITPYWLLGLIEGEGTFCLNDSKNMGISFSLALTFSQYPVILALKSYFNSFAIDDAFIKNYPDIIGNRSYITVKKAPTTGSKPVAELAIRQVNYIVETLIPMLRDLCFVTKKQKDFKDWSFIAHFIYRGLHNTEKGRELIVTISEEMNNYRLSNKGDIKISPNLINDVLNMKDEYIKNQEGLRVNASTLSLVRSQLFYIKAVGSGNEILIFKNSTNCALYFNVTPQTINNRLATGISINRNNDNNNFNLSRVPL